MDRNSNYPNDQMESIMQESKNHANKTDNYPPQSQKPEHRDKLQIQNDRINFFPNPQYLLENYEIAEQPIIENSREDSLSNDSSIEGASPQPTKNKKTIDTRFMQLLANSNMVPIIKLHAHPSLNQELI
jgi:hypothetical protein